LQLTVVNASGDTSTSLPIDVAHILLQAGGCNTACTIGDGSASVLAGGEEWVGGSCDRESKESEEGCADGELHFTEDWISLNEYCKNEW